MEFVIPFSFLVIVLVDAYTDTYRTVRHKRGLLLYALACILVSVFYLKFTDVHWYFLASFALLTRLAAFDPFYNLLKGKPFVYEGDLNKPDTSWFDKLESKLPLSTFWKRILYIIKYISFLIIYFLYA